MFAAVFVIAALVWFFISREQLNRKAMLLTPLLLAVILAFVIGLRPMREDRNAEIRLSNLDVLLVVDSTISMWANDYPNGVRMDGAKATCRYIMNELPGANIALVTFDNHSFIRSPFTQDRETLDSLIENIGELSPYMSVGSDMNIPYNDIESLLKSSAKKENRKAVVFFMSDGEITTGDELSSYEGLRDYVFGGAVLGFGTKEGGKMRYERSFVYDFEEFGDAVSVIDEETLQQIAKDIGVEYLNVTSAPSVGRIVTALKSSNNDILTRKPGVISYTDTYYYYLAPLLLCLFAELFLVLRTEKTDGKKG